MGTTDERLAQLEAEVATLRQRIAELAGGPAGPAGPTLRAASIPEAVSRRHLLAGGALAAVALGAGRGPSQRAALVPEPPGLSPAADGGPVILGATNTSSSATSIVGGASPDDVLRVQDQALAEPATPRGALFAVSTNRNGVVGQTGAHAPSPEFAARAGVLGVAGMSDTYALMASLDNASPTRGLAHLYLVPAVEAGPPTTGAHRVGEVFVDATGKPYCCTASGTPGTWRSLLAGLELLPVPVRAYDSRSGSGPAATGDGPLAGSRTIGLAQGWVGSQLVPAVPSHASGTLVSLTLTATVGSGYAALFAADQPWPGTSNANWSASGQTIAVTTASRVNASRQVTVFIGAGSSHVVLDVLGFVS